MIYKEIEIDFPSENSPYFSAMVGGAYKKCPSLAAIKKVIDKANTFAVFTGLVNNIYKSSTVKIVAVNKAARRFQDGLVFLDNGGREFKELYLNTPQNIKVIAAAKALAEQHEKETDEMSERHERERDKARSLIVTLTPENYREVLAANQKAKE